MVQAKKLLRWNPRDEQGVRSILCTWYLELNDSLGCLNLLRKYDHVKDTELAYADVLLQFLRWEKDDVVEKDVQKALYEALQKNLYVPNLLTAEKKKKVAHQLVSHGGKAEAEMYAQDARRLWKMYPDSIQWLKTQKYSGGKKVPNESDLITLLKSGINMTVTCEHTDIDGNNAIESSLICTQKRSKCVGCSLDDFYWPKQLKRPHQESSVIFLHDNESKEGHDRENCRWRKTTYEKVKVVPFWEILLSCHDQE